MASMKFEEAVALLLEAATRQTGSPNVTAVLRNFGSGSPPSAKAFSETATAQ
jgi:hypothetical protein